MRRHEVKDCQKTISEYLSKSGFTEAPNGNTPSPLSPTNSVGSQVKVLISYEPLVVILLDTFIYFTKNNMTIQDFPSGCRKYYEIVSSYILYF